MVRIKSSYVRVHWRFTSDSGTEEPGFFLDDVQLTQRSALRNCEPGYRSGHCERSEAVLSMVRRDVDSHQVLNRLAALAAARLLNKGRNDEPAQTENKPGFATFSASLIGVALHEPIRK